MANIDQIAKLRGVDSFEAIHFWKQVCTEVGQNLSTHIVLLVLRALGEYASTLSPEKVAALALARLPSEKAKIVPSESKIKTSSPRPNTSVGSDKKEKLTIADSCYRPKNNRANHISMLAIRYDLDEVEAYELHELLKEMSPFDFSLSSQISRYIIHNNLGHKYPNISGIVRMRRQGDEWNFKGGFPPRIYAIICSELRLSEKCSGAKPVGFKSFKQIREN